MSAALAKRGTAPGRHVYDVIVVGGDLAGALSAALLARHGLQVLYLAPDETADGYEHEGWQFSVAPFALPSPRVAPLIDELLAELGLATEFGRLERAAIPPLQVLRPGARFDLPADTAARSLELERSLGAAAGQAFGSLLDGASTAAAATDAFLGSRPELGASGFFSRWKLNRLLARTPELGTPSPLAAADASAKLLAGLAPLACSLHQPGTWALARSVGKLLQQPLLFPGGRAGLRSFLAERARELGADVVTGPEATATLAFDGGKPIGVRLARGDTTFRAAAMISALDVAGLSRITPEERRKPLLKWAPLLETTAAVFTAQAVVPERALPRGLGELALLESTDAELGPLVVAVGPATKRGEVKAELRVLQLSAVAPWALRQGGEAAARAFAERLWAQFKTVGPFTRGHALVESVAWVDAAASTSRHFDPPPLYTLGPRPAAGVVGLPTEGPFARLFLVGRAVLPGLGVEGEFLSAHLAARRIEKLLKKSDPLKSRRSGA